MKEQSPIYLPTYKKMRERGLSIQKAITWTDIEQRIQEAQKLKHQRLVEQCPQGIVLENGVKVNIINHGFVYHEREEIEQPNDNILHLDKYR